MSFRRRLASFLTPLLLLAFVFSAQAAVTASISPSGTLPEVSNVQMTFSYNFGGGSADLNRIALYNVKLNGQDITPAFLNAANFINVSPSRVDAEIEYLFPPGTYTLSTTIQLSGESPVSASSTFTVPGDEQIQNKNTVLSKVSLFMHQWDHRKFAPWISLGNMDVFSNRIFSGNMQVYVDPGYLAGSSAVAAYVEKYIWKYIWTVYDEDLVISTGPENFSNGGANDSETLWHEMIHAVSHGLQLAGSSGSFSYGDDHLYIEWAESCVRGLNWLDNFESYVNSNGIASPPNPTIAANARQRWKKFVTACNSTLFGTMPTEAQKAELSSMIGFNIDPGTIRSRYMSEHNYPAEYFDDITVTITSPSTGEETADNQVDVTAELSIREPGVVADQVGFIVNGALQLSSLSNNTFETTAVLKTGDNIIRAVMLSTAGQTYYSQPITVESNALNNRYHIRITWDKDDTDVDLHFSWSGGSECYFGNKTPTWGGTATSPRLDVDDTNGYGPENITIDSLPGPGAYSIFVDYYSDHGNGPTTVNATIYENGVPVFSNSKTMQDNETWELFNFSL